MKMVRYILILLTFMICGSWAGDFQPILSQISAGNSDCNRNKLLGDFDLKSVPQFNALCNIPIPDFQQSKFLLENNVVPILCMGLMDVSLRLCKSAKDDISPFEDIFPPTATKFNKIFVGLSKSNDFSMLDEFCSTTVKKFLIKEAASNTSQPWWQLLYQQLSDEKHCSDICHSNEENKVHPLCSYILWSNGVFINFQKNKQVEQVNMPLEEDQKQTVVQKVEDTVDEKIKETADQGEKTNLETGYGKNDLISRPSDAVISSNGASSPGAKTQITEASKPNVTVKNVGEGTVKQVLNDINQSALRPTATVKTDANASLGIQKLAEKLETPIGKKDKVKETVTTVDPSKSVKIGTSNTIEDKPISSVAQSEGKVVSPAAAVSSQPEPQDAGVGPPLGQDAEAAKAGDGLVEGDVSIEVTPDGAGMDQPIPADKDFQPYNTDEEGEDGDGDDVDIVESSQANANVNAATNSSGPAGSKAVSVHQSPLEGDKVYSDGEILIEDHFIEAEDSHFFTYFLCMAVLTIMAYLAFHNKKKLIALAVEGRRTKGGRRRPNSSHYSKLDCSLEEALVSNTTASVTHVLY